MRNFSTTTKDLYQPLNLPAGQTLEPCPVCGTAPQLWQYSEGVDKPTTKTVMCSNGDPIGPQIKDGGNVFSGCLLYMPPDDFYRGRIVEAVNYWNEYAKALIALQRTNRWARAHVLREELKRCLTPPTP